MELGDLRKFSTKQIYSACSKYADPEFAALAAWYVFHNKLPNRNLSYLYGPCKKEMFIEKRIIDLILKHYQNNRLTGQTTSLLPVIDN
jgi:hypothetical protein